jgi:hypothetical protein
MDVRIVRDTPKLKWASDGSDEKSGGRFVSVNGGRAELDGDGGNSPICVHAPPDTLVRFQHHHRFTRLSEITGSSETCCACADY